MKTLYFVSSEHIAGEAFFDEEANLVHYNHENDNCYRHEYMAWLAEYFGGKVIKLRVDLRPVDDADTHEEMIGANMALIKRAIRRSKEK